MMDYNNMVPEAEQTTVCPYNKAHVVLNFRFNNHLVKCRKSYQGEELETCPFNASHKIPKPEFFYHKKTCIDRNIVLNYLQCEQSDEQKDKKRVLDWDEEEELERNAAEPKEKKMLTDSSEPSTSTGIRETSVDLKDSSYDKIDIQNFGKKIRKDRSDRHGFDDSDEEVDKKSYNPMAHLQKSLKSTNRNQNENSIPNEHDHENSRNSNKFSSPKRVINDWSDDEVDRSSGKNSETTDHDFPQNDNRNCRESSISSHISIQSFRGNFSRNHSSSPFNSKTRYSPYNRPESRNSTNFRGTSRESDSNVSTASRRSQDYQNKRFDRQERSFDGRRVDNFGLRRSNERFSSRDSSRSRGSSRVQEYTESRRYSGENGSQESSRSREYSENRSYSENRDENHTEDQVRRESGSFEGNSPKIRGYRSRDSSRSKESSNSSNGRRFDKFSRHNRGNSYSFNRGRQNKFGNRDFSNTRGNSSNERKNSNNFNLHEDEFAKIIENVSKSPTENQVQKKISDWSDEEDNTPSAINQNIQKSPETQSKKVSDWSDDEVDRQNEKNEPNCQQPPKLPATENKKVSDWSDDEVDRPTVQTSSLNQQNLNSVNRLEIDKFSDYLHLKSIQKPSFDASNNIRGILKNLTSRHSTNDLQNLKSRSRKDKNDNEIADFNKIPITRSRRSKKYFPSRISDEAILERFSQLSQNKNGFYADTWHDKMYREMVGKN